MRTSLTRPTIADIDLNALEFNLRHIRRMARGRKVLAVVKADAYGHGLVPVARRLQNIGVKYFGVALVEEGLALRKSGVRGRVFIMSGIFPGQEHEIIRANLTPFLFDIGMAKSLNREAKRRGKKVRIHIKVDTGMGRIGVLPGQMESFLKMLRGLTALEVEGMGSHFSESYASDKDFSLLQVRRFEDALRLAGAQGLSIPLRHIANSAGLSSLPESLYTMVRPGIILYGGFPSQEFRATIRVKPVMSLKTRVLYLKEVPPGVPVSYGRSFVTPRRSLIATIPIGYGDGYPRKLSNRGTVLIRGRRVPIVGRVCMDLTMVDVTEVVGVRQGDDVVLFGRQGKEEISSDDLAVWAETVPYEIFTGIGKRVPRVYKG